MNKPQPFIFSDGKVRELDEHFFAETERGRPALPKAQRKRRVNLMLDEDVIAGLRAKGNMSVEANSALREALDL